MKTTFDLPDALLHKAKAVAARQGRPLRDLVSDALQRAVTEAERMARAGPDAGGEWEAFLAKVEVQPDGSFFNPEGIQDERFFEILDSLRDERLRQPLRDPFEGFGFSAVQPAPAKPASRKKPSRR